MMKIAKFFPGIMVFVIAGHFNAAMAFSMPKLPAASAVGCFGPASDGLCFGGAKCTNAKHGQYVFAAQNGTETAGGVQFCTVHVIGYRYYSSHRTDATWYVATPTNNSSPRCVYLCENGWGGKDCSKKLSEFADEYKVCVPQVMSESLYSSMSTGPDTGDNIYTDEGWTDRHDCNDTQYGQRASDRDHEFEVTYGIVKWLPSGHGARVAPIAARGFCGRNKTEDECLAILNVVGTEEIMCMPGYELNRDSTDCVVAAGYKDVCDGIVNCEDWPADKFASSDYIRVLDEKEQCYKYRCAQSGYGFAGDPTTNSTCKECPSSMTQGVSLITGKCLTAQSGYLINQAATTEAEEILKAEALYTNDFLKQDSIKKIPCWMSAQNPEEFKNCVTKGAAKEKAPSPTPDTSTTTLSEKRTIGQLTGNVSSNVGTYTSSKLNTIINNKNVKFENSFSKDIVTTIK